MDNLSCITKSYSAPVTGSTATVSGYCERTTPKAIDKNSKELAINLSCSGTTSKHALLSEVRNSHSLSHSLQG